MKRLFRNTICIMLAAVLLAGLAGCSAETPSPSPSGYSDGVIGENKSISDDKHDLRSGTYEAAPAYADREMYAAVDGMDDFVSDGVINQSPRAGLLTAAEIKDRNDLLAWTELFRGQDPTAWQEYTAERGLYSGNIVAVNVKDQSGAPVYNVTVELRLKSDDSVIYTARTDIAGDASLFYPDSASKEAMYAVCSGISADCGGPNYNAQSVVTLQIDAAGAGVTALDLMLMIDTTGSMSDELDYLKEELADMVRRVSEADSAVSIRVSVNFYRDEGDEYVVKYFDFREDINECVSQIKEQYADGGGDFPEAVHTALDNAVSGHKWRDEAVKICFMVLDAPPHTESETQGINAQILASVKEAARQGIRIIPVASSGIDRETECILRSFAIMTGGTYVFLTDDSGIGGSHLTPEDKDYSVEALNECMIRIVSEYCGIPYTAPEPGQEAQNSSQTGYQQ